jgi:rhodanese-related sulfurtransferase
MGGKIVFISILFFIGTLAVFAQSGSKSTTELSQEELEKGVLVDVRTPEEYRSGHMEGARNIDWLGENFMRQVAELPENKTIYLYCQKGGRSARAAHLLDSLGYSVIDLRGGFQALNPK